MVYPFAFIGPEIQLPAAGDVEDGVAYGVGGDELTGNVVLPAPSDVRYGTGYGELGTEFLGTFEGVEVTPGNLDNHSKVLNCIKEFLEAGIAAEISQYNSDNENDPYLAHSITGKAHNSFGNIRIEDFELTALPSSGIIISPDRDAEGPGTNESNDITYSSLVIRIAHALGSEDKDRRLAFRQLVSGLFHRKKIRCGNECMVISTVDFGAVKIPSAWNTKNMSISIQRVNWQLRSQVGHGASIG